MGLYQKTNEISINIPSQWDLFYDDLKRIRERIKKIKKSAPDSYRDDVKKYLTHRNYVLKKP
jgi:hypothetical protein